MKKKRNIRKIHVAVLVVAIIIIGFTRIHAWLDNYYRATNRAWNYIDEPRGGVEVTYKDNTIVYMPKEPKAGLIFYPGGLVETEAYAPLLEQLAENDIMAIEVEMPHYLALLDANGARGIQAKYPEITDWYLAGHSLGGAMASLYADRHQAEYDGLILLAAYSTKDLTDEPDIDVLLVRGSEDKVLSMEKYDENLANLPEDYKEVVIEGGCHAYFGDYGHQAGDGTPSISVEEQTKETVDSIVEFITGESHEKVQVQAGR